MSQAAYPRLWQMFGAFFHQDWDTEGDDWPDLVRNFAGGQPQSELDATAAELDRLVADLPDDAERYSVRSGDPPGEGAEKPGETQGS